MRMNNSTRIMIPFWAQGPEVTLFGISFSRHSLKKFDSGGVLVSFHTPKGDWIRCELAGTWLARGAGTTISPTRPRTIVCCEGSESGQLKGMSGGRGWYFPEHVE